MPTKRRIFKKDCYYHIYNRGNRKEPILFDNIDSRFILRKLRYILEQYKSEELCAYAIMHNHYHLLFKVNQPEVLPNIMRHWGAAVSRHFNFRYNKVGRLFQSRYQSRRVLAGHSLIYVSRYIHRNPLDLPEVGSIIQLLDYPWSSLYDIHNNSIHEILKVEHFIRYFDNHDDYVRYVLARNYRKALRYITSNKIFEDFREPITFYPRG
jgi:REP element-mobilizing transposase RayT